MILDVPIVCTSHILSTWKRGRDWERNQKDAMDAYCTRMGVQKWHAWIEELENENYIKIKKYLKMDKLPNIWGTELVKFINMYYGK